MELATRWLAASIVAVAFGTAAAAEPPVRLSEDGTEILYRAELGDTPGAVAERFGIAAPNVPAFLLANGIRDATRVPSSHVYRIPNPLAARAADAEARAAALTQDLATARSQVATLGTEAAAERARADDEARRAASLTWLARIWPVAQLVGLLLVIVGAGAVYVAYTSARRLSATEHYARGLAEQLDERRRSALAERQAAARRVLDLEEAVRMLEREVGTQRTLRPRPTGTH